MNPSSQVALVTGANKGIGKAIAEGLAKQGIIVLIGSRNAERGAVAAAELAQEGIVHSLQLDVTDASSIQAAAEHIAAQYGKLDILINNAGTNVSRNKPGVATLEEFREVYETNVFGVVAVTNALLPLLRQAPAARIVNISSLRGSLGAEGAFTGQPSISYSSSKTALNALTVHYARELADTPIKVNAGAPGHVATDFNGHSGTRTPEEGAAIAIHLATLDENGPTGGFFDDKGPIAW
ncbi:SDR family oxidoreductase [Paenibacillus sp. NPDC057934]|uniref:SDR family oxidoreductase n=1 Tax=Paenibacillus sp. NPDC057934 TaxID=3346282 RepID=UPI0036DB26FC